MRGRQLAINNWIQKHATTQQAATNEIWAVITLPTMVQEASCQYMITYSIHILSHHSVQVSQYRLAGSEQREASMCCHVAQMVRRRRGGGGTLLADFNWTVSNYSSPTSHFPSSAAPAGSVLPDWVLHAHRSMMHLPLIDDFVVLLCVRVLG